MNSRRKFLQTSGVIAAGTLLIPNIKSQKNKFTKDVGVQLYTLRQEMLADNLGTLKKLAKLGYKELESAASTKGYYYGFTPAEIKKVCSDLGMTLRSGHVHYDDKWQQTMDDAKESGQEYLIVSSMPSRGQTVDNYKSVAQKFNEAGESCKAMGLKFGYHNHEYEFEKENGHTLYDILLSETDPTLVNMELDLGWVFATGNDPLGFLEKYPNRFPLWHLKDMDVKAKHSTEFGKGGLDIAGILKVGKKTGMKYFFVEQEEYTSTPFEALAYNYEYLKKLKD